MSKERLFGLIGFPLSHSFSSKYFNDKFKREELPCRYENFEINRLVTLETVLIENPGLNGLNVTIPYKEEVLTYLDDLDPEAGIIGAVNVIQIKDGHKIGFNTDFQAFIETLTPLLRGHEKRALILGTGGASRAIAYGLKNMGIDYTMISRKRKMEGITYEDLNEVMIQDHHIIINTTPLGTFPNSETYPDIPYDLLSTNHLLYDLVYNPEKSVFLSKGEAMGCRISNGYAMLVRQAELSWEIWNQ